MLQDPSTLTLTESLELLGSLPEFQKKVEAHVEKLLIEERRRKFISHLFNVLPKDLLHLEEWFLKTVDFQLFSVSHGVWAPSYDDSHNDEFIMTEFMRPFVCRYCRKEIDILHEDGPYIGSVNTVFPTLPSKVILGLYNAGKYDQAIYEIVKLITSMSLVNGRFKESLRLIKDDHEFSPVEDFTLTTCS